MSKDQNTKNTQNSEASPCVSNEVPCETLIIHGGEYHTTLTKKYKSRKKWVKPDPRKVVSYIPGTIKEIFIKEGDQVSKGDKMLILEAMKMLTEVEVPMDGKIKQININPEDKVPKGHLMIEFE